MTTDTHPKAISGEIRGLDDEPVTLSIIAKGSGMVAPNMATVLVWLFTDAEVEPRPLDQMLRRVVDRTFNMLSVDTDTSTSDTCAILANGRAGPVDGGLFEEALLDLSVRMTEMLARDGEGATRLLRVAVTGATSVEDARAIARSMVESPLIKTMVHGGDPNVGRLLMAVGKCVSARVDPARLTARVGRVDVVHEGRRLDFDHAGVRALLLDDPVDLQVDLGLGTDEARAWGCDLSHGYIDENAAYYSS
jgi:glutamate N-acetyltransferase/amino-acid N-acetyltransferase